jgi:hypothetical protein
MLYFVHYGLILDFGGRTLFFGAIYILVLVSEILVEEIQNSRENFYIDQQYEKFRKKKCLVEVIGILVLDSTSHPEHLFFLLIFFYFQVTLVT